MAKRLHELSQRSQAVVFVLLCGMTAAGGWQVVIGPSRAELESRRARLDTIQAELSQAQAVAARLPQFERELQELEAGLLETTAILPDEKDPQDVLRSLHRFASESSLDLASFEPQDIVTRAQYDEWPIELGFEGGFHDLGVFFDRIARESRLISISDLNVKAVTTPSGRRTVTASCVATTFVFKNEPVTAGLAAGGPQ
jgi:type IV pilus assembly protein PilO